MIACWKVHQEFVRIPAELNLAKDLMEYLPTLCQLGVALITGLYCGPAWMVTLHDRNACITLVCPHIQSGTPLTIRWFMTHLSIVISFLIGSYPT